METFDIRNLNFTYPGRKTPAVRELNLQIMAGEFLVLCGPSGCGKSTLLRQLKTALRPHGVRTGTVFFEGKELDALDQRTQSQRIGFVQQDPERQIVTDKVWHELAFGLESLGCDTPTIRRRVAEMASFFGIQEWFYKPVSDLSGGQKQLLNLAAVMVMQPSVLILDEPTSQLDPIAATEFLGVLGKINRELGTTVLLTEHRLEEAFPLATRVAVMERGQLLCTGTPEEVGQRLKRDGHDMFLAMPAAMQVWAAVESGDPCPVTVREGRDWLEKFARTHALRPLPEEEAYHSPEPPVIDTQEVWFRYEKKAADIVKGLSLSVQKGEFLALLGGNGTGKTTTLLLLAGVHRPYRGEIQVGGTVGMLPQDPRTLFVKKTLREDLFAALNEKEACNLSGEERVAEVARLCRLETLLDSHPYDLSGGEQQRAALAKVLLMKPEILLMDEPTKGLDAESKRLFGAILRALQRRGVTIIMVSHDMDFCARYAHRCALFFDGTIVAEGTPQEFFSGNNFYTTAANRMARQQLPRAVTPEEVITACGGIVPPELELQECALSLPTVESPVWEEEPFPESYSKKEKLSKRTWIAMALILLLIPLTLYVGQAFLSGRKYYLISMIVLLECMFPFFLLFESRKPQARELIVIAVLCAIGVAGRAVFFMLPQFKPVMAIAILAGVAFGGESGFLVGAVTMLASNVLFGQGPWTPWQMFCMGIIGFLAGVLCRKGWLRRTRASLALFGGISAVLIYGGIMNTASALMWSGELNGKILLTYYLSGLPMDCVHAGATWLFLWIGAEPMLEKLERIKVKYGLIENESHSGSKNNG